MSIRMSESELEAAGFEIGADGIARRKGTGAYATFKKGISVGGAGKVSKSKQGLRSRQGGSNENQKTAKEDSKRGNKKSRQTTNKKTSLTSAPPVTYIIRVISHRKRHMDPDNLCPKYYIDEIVRAGVIPDDSSRYIMEVRKSVIQNSTEREYTEIIIDEVIS